MHAYKTRNAHFIRWLFARGFSIRSHFLSTTPYNYGVASPAQWLYRDIDSFKIFTNERDWYFVVVVLSACDTDSIRKWFSKYMGLNKERIVDERALRERFAILLGTERVDWQVQRAKFYVDFPIIQPKNLAEVPRSKVDMLL